MKVKAVITKSHLVKDLGADSLDLVEIIMEIEKEFGIIIPDDDAESITTVKEATEYVKNKVRTK